MVNVLKAKERTSERRSQLRELREQGGIPGIVYGYKTENTPISIDNADFIKTMREVGRNGVIHLDVDGKRLNVVLQEYQEDPIRNQVIHADFLAVDLDQEIDADVLVELIGEAAGAKEGGIVQHILHELSVTAKPEEFPEAFRVDISKLEIGDTISVGEIRDQYSVTINHEDDEAIVTILAPQVEEEEETEEAAEAPEAEEAGAEEE